MKILKIKIKRNQNSTGTHYTYPFGYDATKIHILCYESMLPENYNQIVAKGNTEELMIGVVKDEDIFSFLQSSDAIEITETEALLLGTQWTKQTEIITSSDVVLTVLAKVARNVTLTQTEKNAIDPNNSELGINLSRSFQDELIEYKMKL